MNKFFLSFFCLFLASSSALLASKNLTKIPPGKVMVVEFTQHRHLASLPTPIISTGTLKIIPQKGLVWETKTPFPNTLVIQKKGLFQGQDGTLTPLNKAPQNDLIFNLLSKIFDGNFQENIDGFESEKIPSDKDNWAIKLTPENDSIKLIIQSLEIYGDAQISKIIIRRPQGNFDEIHLKNHTFLTRDKALSSHERGWFNDS